MEEAGSSSPFSAESNFRELDDVFLQTQARIWIGEILQTRLDENVNMSDLLADGELLFQVSGELWRELSTRYKGLRHVEAYNYEPISYRKISSRSYMPYSNVDSFLKICKIMGLTGVDLFTPSDVVEKKSTRKVCMCIRSLSNKARTKQFTVPDFDVVTCTVAMPTDNVGCIRRSLELSQSSSLSNSSSNSDKVLIENLKKKNFVAAYNKKFNMCSEESVDDSDCNSTIQPVGSSTACSYYASSQISSNLADSPGVLLVVEESAPARPLFPSEKDVHNIESLFLNESSGSCCLHGEDDIQQEGFSSSSSVDSLMHLSVRTSPVKTITNSYEAGELYLHDLDVYRDDVEDIVGSNTQQRHDITNRVSMSDMIFQETGISDRTQFDRNDSCFREYGSPSSQGSNSTPRTIENGFTSKLHDINDVELHMSSAAELRPTADVVLNLGFDDQLDAGYDAKVVLFSSELHDCKDHLINNESENTVKYKSPVHHPTFLTDADAAVSCEEKTRMSSESKVECDDAKLSEVESNVLKDFESLELLSGQSYSPFDFHLWDQKGKCAVNGNGTSQSISQQSFLVENACCNPSKSAADTLVQDIKADVTNSDKEILNPTTFESDQSNNHFQSERRSVDEDCPSQHLEKVFLYDRDQNGHKLDAASEGDPLFHQDASCPPTAAEPILDKDLSSTTECLDNLGCHTSQACIDPKNDFPWERNTPETLNQDNYKHKGADGLAVESSARTDDSSAATCKPHGRLLLKSVVRGSAVLGALFLFLQLRRTSRLESDARLEKVKKETDVKRGNGVKPSAKKQQKESRVNGVYPANKLVFGA